MYGKLYQEMKSRGITQARLAEVCGVSKFTILHKLQGKSDFTSSEMYAICNIINDVPMHELFKKD